MKKKKKDLLNLTHTRNRQLATRRTGRRPFVFEENHMSAINEFICSVPERIRDSMKQTAAGLEMGLAEVIARVIITIIEVIK